MKVSHPLHFVYGTAFLLILLLSVGLYGPGLQGDFILDDVPNLADLSTLDRSSPLEVGKFALGGFSGQLGRPLSMFTFALQAPYWPDNPEAFKYVNLLIHLINGCLIFWLLLRLTSLMPLPEERGLLLAFLTSALWLMHPLQVSTVLYTVQRMTELSTLFTVLALLGYLKGRAQLTNGQVKIGLTTLSLSVVGGGLLAVLSKENGILLLLYLIVLELTILQALPKPKCLVLWIRWFIYLPLGILVVYFTLRFNSMSQVYEVRDFTLSERLLTETRVLCDYLNKILFPRPQSFGLLHDDFPISHGIFEPPTTVVALLFLTTLFIAAVILRRIYPVLAFGILWFFAGHVLESSFIGLVIYFEHRNYLAMLGIVFAVIYGLLWIFDHMHNRLLRRLAMGFALLWLLLSPFITHGEADLWGKPALQTELWAREKPLSRYAQMNAAALFSGAGNFPKAFEYVHHMIQVFPHDTTPYLLWLASACLDERAILPDKEKILKPLEESRVDTDAGSVLSLIVGRYANQQCPRLPKEWIEAVFQTLLNNPSSRFYQTDILLIYGKFYAADHNFNKALEMIDTILIKEDTPPLRMQRLIWLLDAHRFQEALSYVSQTRGEFSFLQNYFYSTELDATENLAQQLQEIFQELQQRKQSIHELP